MNAPQQLEKIYIPPMAGVTDLVFRRLMRHVLADKAKHVRLSTEMISSKGIMYQNNPSRMRLSQDEVGKVIIQLFGHEPEVLARAAQMAEKAGAAGIDINMGCPVPKIVNGKDGAALMKEPCLAEAIVKEVVAAVDIPVSVKTRLGWNDLNRNVIDFSLKLQDAGISSITVHGRTRAQSYSGMADWEAIAKVKNALDIPVFANGDIDTPEKALQALQLTNAHGIAIARACIGNPWVILNTVKKLLGEDNILPPTPKEKIETALAHVELTFDDKGEKGIQALKRHMSKYVSGLRPSRGIFGDTEHVVPGAAHWRQTLATATSYESMKNTLQEILSIDELVGD